MSNDHQSHRKAGQVGSGRPSGARRLGAGFLAALLAVSISLIVIPPGVAVAAVEGFEPRSGTISIERGSTVDVTVTMSGSLLSCHLFSTSAPGSITASFDQICGLLTGAPVQMPVKVSASTPLGPHFVQISEVALIGGSLLAAHYWHFEVVEPVASTTTSTVSPTSSSSTSTTTPPVATTTSLGATSTTSQRGSTTTTVGSPTTTTGATTTSIRPATTTTSGPFGDSDDEAGGGGEDAPKVGDPGAGLPSVAISSELFDTISRSVPPGVAEVALSPVIVAEILLRALRDLLIPLATVTALAIFLLWRLRSELEADGPLFEGSKQ